MAYETCDTDNTIIPFRPALVDITGSMYAACLLSQLVYWSRRSRNPDGWVYKSQKDLYRELRLNRYQLERARAQLQRLGFVETVVKRANGQPVTHYRVNAAAVESALFELNCAVPPGNVASVKGEQMDVRKAANSTCAGCASGFGDGEEMDLSTVNNSVTETTPEITTESTPDISGSRNAREREQICRSDADDGPWAVSVPEGLTGDDDARAGADAATDPVEPGPTLATDALFAVLERTARFPSPRDHRRLREIMADYPGIDHYLEFKKFAEFWSGREMGNPWLALRNWLDYARNPARSTHSYAAPAVRSRYLGAFRRQLPRVYTPPPVYDD